MKDRSLVVIGVAILIGVALACSPFSPPAPPPTSAPSPTPVPSPTSAPPPTAQPPPTSTPLPPPPPPAPETVSFTVYNDSAVVVCYVFISPVEEGEWGEDWLGASEVIGTGESRTFEVPPGVYDLRAVDCDSNEIAVEWEVDIAQDTTWTISGGTLDPLADPNFGTVDLTAGFVPDPYLVNLTSGGAIDAAALNLGDECYGFVSSPPDFRVNWDGVSNRLRFFFVAANADEDTTLLVNDPYGNWHCDDDFGATFNPLVDINSPPSGQYDIWVGSFEEDTFVDGTLYITEMDYSPEDLP